MKAVRMLRLFLALLVVSVGNSSATPLTLHHQGLLTDNSGAPLNGSFSLTFRLYSAPTAGIALWTETQTVTATDGLFEATLGLTTPISASLFSGAQPALYLGVSVGADGELSPRATLSSAPYSLHSAEVDGFSAGPGNINLGQFSFVGGDSNTVNSDYSSILGGSENTVDVTQFADTIFDTTGLFPSARTFGVLHPPGSGTILGGHAITVSGNHSVIVQGWQNDISAAYGFMGSGFRNRILGDFSSIDGGLYNTINSGAPFSIIGGGGKNTANGGISVIAGGGYNTTTANFKAQVIGGGLSNSTNGSVATVGGGSNNRAEGLASTIAGGDGNLTSVADHQFIGGGQNNKTNGDHSTIGGGRDNETNIFATVGGGMFNKAFGEYAFIGGGLDNVVNGFAGAVAGGTGNFASGSAGAIGGGDGNKTGPGNNATVPGGFRNVAGATNSFAAGTRAQANDSCAFVWADCCVIGGTPNSAVYSSSAPNTFNARATNGFYFLTSCDSLFDPATGVGSGVYVPAGGSMWMTGSSRTLKKNITPVDEDDILERVDQMPVYRWSYKEQGDDVQHIGPMAEDFYETFDIGENDRTIGALDPAGVSLAATKALIKENKELKARLERLEKLVSNLLDEE